MKKLRTRYLGLELRSPVIVSSSRLTSNIDNLVEAEENGAGAVVLKSLFEEQINHHISELSTPAGYPEADDYISSYARSHSVDSYIDLVKTAKKELHIPVIPSINCYSTGGWIDFSKKIEDAGADALEINAFFMPVDRKMPSADAERLYLDLVEKIMKKISIPVVLKIGMRFSNILYMIDQFYARGVKGVVMFNRFFEPDIDINTMEIISSPVFSTGSEKRFVLRWVAMASGQGTGISISASTGVTDGSDVIKYLLAGADTVQVCSVLYQKGMPFLKTINQEIASWMDSKNFERVTDFRGRLNMKNIEKPVFYERTQFMRYFSSVD